MVTEIQPAAFTEAADPARTLQNMLHEKFGAQVRFPRRKTGGYVRIAVVPENEQEVRRFVKSDLVRACNENDNLRKFLKFSARARMVADATTMKTYAEVLASSGTAEVADTAKPPKQDKKKKVAAPSSDKPSPEATSADSDPPTPDQPSKQVAEPQPEGQQRPEVSGNQGTTDAITEAVIAAVRQLIEPLMVRLASAECDLARIVATMDFPVKPSPARKRRDARPSPVPKPTHDLGSCAEMCDSSVSRDLFGGHERGTSPTECGSREHMCHSPASSDMFGGTNKEQSPSGSEFFPAEDSAEELNLTIEIDMDSEDHPSPDPVRAGRPRIEDLRHLYPSERRYRKAIQERDAVIRKKKMLANQSGQAGSVEANRKTTSA